MENNQDFLDELKKEIDNYQTPTSGFYAKPEFTEDEKYYKVKIHYNDKNFIKKVKGWRWNPSDKKWYFEKTKFAYEAFQVFKKYASTFEINEPSIDQNKNSDDSDNYATDDLNEEEKNINIPDESEYHFDNNYGIEESLNSRLGVIERQLNTLNEKITDYINPDLLTSKPKSDNEFRNNTNPKVEKESNFDDVIKQVIGFYPNDEFNQLFEKFNFTIEQPADMVQNILNLIECELMELIPQEEYKIECIRLGTKYKDRDGVAAHKYKLSIHQLNHFVRGKRYLHFDPNQPDAFKLLDAAINLRNKILKSQEKEGLNRNLKTVYTLNFVLLTRILWERIKTR